VTSNGLPLNKASRFFLLRAMGRLMAKSILDYSFADIARILGGKVYGSGTGRYVLAPAPGHSVDDESLSIKIGRKGLLVHSFADEDINMLRDYVSEKLSLPAFSGTNGKRRPAKKSRASARPKPIPDSIDGMTPDERLEAAISAKPGSGAAKDMIPIEIYDYKDADGIVRYQVRRYEPKEFPQFRPDGNGGWIPGLGNIEKLPYHLDEIAARPNARVFIFEGEKDADRAIAEFSICATTASGGAKWSNLAKYFEGREAFIVPDHDAEGQKKGRQW
jgi:hypothetical protein